MRRHLPERADELGHPDTWSFTVVAEKYTQQQPGELTVLGWTAQPVRYTPGGSAYTGITRTGSDMAERSALIGAAMWRLALNHGITTVFCSDSALGGGQAQGVLGTAVQDPSYELLRGLFQALELALPGDRLTVHHDRAHTGDLFNEIADVAAKREAAKSFNLPRQKLDLNVWHSHFCQLWTICGHHCGLPKWHEGSLDVAPPTLPTTAREADVCVSGEQPHYKTIDFFCSFASANVQSLYRGPHGHGGKLHYLQDQMRSFGLNFLAIQEARSESGSSSARNILRLSSGHDQGQYGIEIWCDLAAPFGKQRKGPSIYFRKEDFQVVHADPRKMLLRCTSKLTSFWIFAGHAPHSGYSKTHRDQWWQDVHQLFQQYLDGEPLVLLMDANASPGDRDDWVVLKDGFATSANTAAFRDLLATWQLYLPASSRAHVGTQHTWTSFNGDSEHCIDHVALPFSWFDRCTLSQVLLDFDMATMHEDHAAVAVQVEWQELLPVNKDRSGPHHGRKRASFRCDTEAHQGIINATIAPWTTDVETQSHQLVDQLHRALRGSSGVKHEARKPFLTQELWDHRQNKLIIKKKLRSTRQQLGRQFLWTCLQAWRHQSHAHLPIYDEQFVEVSRYTVTLLCCQTKLVFQYKKLALVMKKLMQTAKQKAIQEEIVQQAPNMPATELLRRLRRFVGPSNPQKQSTKPLPLILKEDGKPCTTH